jgi:hypothetical protein
MTTTRLAGDDIYCLSKEGENEYCRLIRLTKYFEKIDTAEVINHNSGSGNNDEPMDTIEKQGDGW